MTWCYHMQGSSSKKPTLTESDSEENQIKQNHYLQRTLRFLTERGDKELSESMFDNSSLPNFSTLNIYPLHLSVLDCLMHLYDCCVCLFFIKFMDLSGKQVTSV